jgi:hemolysin III
MAVSAGVPDAPVKPLLRGWLHQCAVFVAVGAGAVLTAVAPTARASLAAVGFTASFVLLFGVSATYHRINWSPAARAWMRRADHASIFVLIAGTYTPIALVGLPSAFGNRLLAIVWAGAAVGVLQTLFWIHAPKFIPVVLAVALGWVIVPYWSEAQEALSTRQLGLLLAGGIFYTVGALFYAAKRPNPVPAIFGYHEMFHLCTIIAAVLHFMSVQSIIRGTG